MPIRQGDWAKITELARATAALQGCRPDERPHRSAAWQALQAHAASDAGQHLRELFAEDPQPLRQVVAAVWTTCCSTTPRTASPTRRCGCCSTSPGRPTSRAGATRCSRARRSTSPRTARSCTSRCATASNRPILVDGKDVMPGGQRACSRRCATSPSGSAAAPGAGHTGKTHHRRRQHRHRRLRPRPGDGHRGAEALPASRTCAPHFVSNVDGTHLAETLRAARPGAHAVHRRLARRSRPRRR